MLFLLRKIRRKLLTDNKVTTYLLYAIGEIILVVVGILIAVQIDNWNEQRKQSDKMNIALQSLRKELVSDSVNIFKRLQPNRNELAHCNLLLQKIKSPEATLDSLVHYAKNDFRVGWVAYIDYNSASFENMKSSGIFEELPDTLKTRIRQFYNTQEFWAQISEKVYQQYQTKFDEYTTTYTFNEANSEDNYLSKVTWDDVDPDHFAVRFLFMVGTRRMMFLNYCEELEEVLAQSRALIQTIDQFLKAS